MSFRESALFPLFFFSAAFLLHSCDKPAAPVAIKAETCVDRFFKQAASSIDVSMLQGKSSFIFDFTKADKKEAINIISNGFGGSGGPENVIFSLGADEAAIQSFYKADTDMKLPSILFARVSLLRVEGPFGTVSDTLREGCKRETAGVKLVSISVSFPRKPKPLNDAEK